MNIESENNSEVTENEVWKDIPGWEGSYQVSDLGRVRSLDRVIVGSNGTVRNYPGMILSSRIEKGYERIRLSKNSKSTDHNVHRLVLYAFIGESSLQVDHIDSNPSNNRLSNLRYCTGRENIHFHVKKKGSKSKYMGVSFVKNQKFGASISIHSKSYHLGDFSEEIDAAKAYEVALYNWENFKKLPPRYHTPTKTSKYFGVDFHKASQKWRVRDRGDKYVGLFSDEDEAGRISNLLEYITERWGKPDDRCLKKFTTKYCKGLKPRRKVLDTNTGKIYLNMIEVHKDLNLPKYTIKSLLEKESSYLRYYNE